VTVNNLKLNITVETTAHSFPTDVISWCYMLNIPPFSGQKVPMTMFTRTYTISYRCCEINYTSLVFFPRFSQVV